MEECGIKFSDYKSKMKNSIIKIPVKFIILESETKKIIMFHHSNNNQFKNQLGDWEKRMDISFKKD